MIARFTGGTPRIKVVFNRPSAFTAVQWNTSSARRHRRPDDLRPQRAADGCLGCRHPVRQLRPDRGVLVSRSGALLLGAGERLDACGRTDARVRPSRSTSPPPMVRPTRSSEARPAPFHFYGTSASAPHAAAVAALQRQAPAVPDAGPDPRRAPRLGPPGRQRSIRTRRLRSDRRDDRGVGSRSVPARRAGRAGGPQRDALVGHDLLDQTGVARLDRHLVPDHEVRRALIHGQTRRSTPGTTATTAPWPDSRPARSIGSGLRRPTATGQASASGYSAYVAPPFASLSAFTTQQFQDFAGRSPTSTELSARRTRCCRAAAGGATPATQVAAATAFSYVGAAGRSGDPPLLRVLPAPARQVRAHLLVRASGAPVTACRGRELLRGVQRVPDTPTAA